MAGMAALTAGHQPRTYKHYPDCQCVHGKVWSTTHYPEGGSLTIWITDGSSATDNDNNDKENNIPRSIFSQLSSHKMSLGHHITPHYDLNHLWSVEQ